MPDIARPHLKLAATCACGAVRLSVDGIARGMLLCACPDCQKASGTGHAAVVLINAEDFSLSGATASFSRPADSGATFTRHFCPACGTPMHGGSSRAPRLAMLPAGLFAGMNGWFRPNQMIFARSHQDWDMVESELPRYATYRDAEARAGG